MGNTHPKLEAKLNKIKALFIDVDYTALCLYMKTEDGKRTVGFPDYDEWLKYNIFNNAYKECEAPKGMYNIVKALHDKGVKVYGLTECSNSFEYNSKYNRLREVYPGIFNHHGDLISCDDRKRKIKIMQLIAERDNLNIEEIMFIDDSYSEVMEAFAAGIFSMHTTEALDRFGNGFNTKFELEASENMFNASAEIINKFTDGEVISYSELIRRLPNQFAFREELLNIPRHMSFTDRYRVSKDIKEKEIQLFYTGNIADDSFTIIQFNECGIDNIRFYSPEPDDVFDYDDYDNDTDDTEQQKS